jgi:diaminopimelate epimerase
MRFTKMQGAGNDFVLLEAGNGQRDWSRLAIALCDRHFGVGADGLLVALPSEKAHFRMRIFNADGSESSACGNGLRCLVKHFIDQAPAAAAADEIVVETMAGVRRAKLRHSNGRVAEIQVGMGRPAVGRHGRPACLVGEEGPREDVASLMAFPLAVAGRELPLNLVSMGNPHAVWFLDDEVSDFPLAELGPRVERHPAFPDGTNFEIVNLKGRSSVEARVWERGVGETLACGSGACAICVAARILGKADRRVDVKLAGGVLNVEWDGVGEVYLSGPAETVFTGEWP